MSTGGMYVGAPGTVGAAIAREDRNRLLEEEKQNAAMRSSDLQELARRATQGNPNFLGSRTLEGQLFGRQAMDANELFARANPEGAAQLAMQRLGMGPPKAPIVAKPGEVILDPNNNYSQLASVPTAAEPFKPTNMQLPGTDRVSLARTQGDFDKLASRGYVVSGTSVPGAPANNPVDPYKRVDYWRDKIDPEFKAVNEASISLQKIENAINSGASLSTAIQLLQKIIDERGVVRGEDVRMFQDAQPLLESWKQELVQSKSGTLTPESANRVLSTARALVSARYGAFNNNFQAIAPLMQGESVNPNSVIPQQVLDRFSTRRFLPPQAAAGTAQAADGIPKPQSQEDFNALPSGAVYIDPDDGRQYRKP